MGTNIFRGGDGGGPFRYSTGFLIKLTVTFLKMAFQIWKTWEYFLLLHPK